MLSSAVLTSLSILWHLLKTPLSNSKKHRPTHRLNPLGRRLTGSCPVRSPPPPPRTLVQTLDGRVYKAPGWSPRIWGKTPMEPPPTNHCIDLILCHSEQLSCGNEVVRDSSGAPSTIRHCHLSAWPRHHLSPIFTAMAHEMIAVSSPKHLPCPCRLPLYYCHWKQGG